MTIHEVQVDVARAGRLARREDTIDVQPDIGFQPKEMIRWQTGVGHVVTATIIDVYPAAQFPAGLLRPDACVLTFELYRTWIVGQPGPGDWSEAALAKAETMS